MTLQAKEKAKELVEKMFMQSTSRYDAEKCALIAVDLHLEELSKMKLIFSDRELHYKYWQKVKSEIQNL
jgi:hypothetical protein